MNNLSSNLTRRRRQLLRRERGLSTVEYVIILVLIAAVCVATWASFGGKLKSWLGSGTDTIDTEIKESTGGGRNREPLPRGAST